MRHLSLLALAMAALAGCYGDDEPRQVDVAGVWSYDWQVRADGAAWEGWDGHFRGELQLVQHGIDVTGTIGYPVEDPATLFGDPEMRDAWDWQVAGVLVGAELHLFAPPPNTKWDDGWIWHLTVDGDAMAGPSWAGASHTAKWPFRATRADSLE